MTDNLVDKKRIQSIFVKRKIAKLVCEILMVIFNHCEFINHKRSSLDLKKILKLFCVCQVFKLVGHHQSSVMVS